MYKWEYVLLTGIIYIYPIDFIRSGALRGRIIIDLFNYI